MVRHERAFRLRVAILVTTILVIAPASTSFAQSDTELTEAQLDYNNQGVMRINEGKYDEALSYFQSSLAVGEANVTFLNLGRTYAHMGRCAEAAAAFNRVESAPQVTSPPPVAINKILKRYRAELDDKCSARLQLSCPQEAVSVVIDESPGIACTPEPLPVTPGEHRIEVSFRGQTRMRTVEARAGQTAKFDVVVPREPVEPTVGSADGSNGVRTAAWVAAVTGGVLLTTGLVLDQTVVGSRLEQVNAASTAGDRSDYRARLEDYRAARNLNRGVIITGGAAATTGIILWILSSDNGAEPAAGASVRPRQGGASLELNWRW